MSAPFEEAGSSITAPEANVRGFRARDVRGKLEFQPGSAQWNGLVRGFAPIVYGLALSLVEKAEWAEEIAVAVFRTFALRRRKLARRTLLAGWFFQTTLIAVRRERRRLKMPVKMAGANGVLLPRLLRLAKKFREALLLTHLFHLPGEQAAQVLRIRPQRLTKRVQKGLDKLRRPLRKMGAEPEPLLQALTPPIPPEAVERILLVAPQTEPRQPLVDKLIWSWRWIALRRAVKRTVVTLSSIVWVIALLGGTVAYLASHGYMTMFFMRMGQRQELKDFPEMFKPAKTWPATDQDRALVPPHPPATPAELFGLTNIWPVKLSFTEAQWKGMEPSHVEPVRNIFQNGRVILRNPKAKRSGLSGVIGFEFNWTDAELEFAGQNRGKVGVRYRGNGTYLNSLFGPKQSLKLDFSKYQKGNDLAGLDELNLLNCIVDYSFMHDALAQNLFRELGAIGPRTAYAYVTLEIEGKPQPRGLYVAIENIDGDFAKDRFGDKRAPIFKPVTYDLFTDLGNEWEAYKEVYDLKTKASPEQVQRVIDFAKLVSHASDEQFAQRLPEFLDLEEFAGFLAGHVLLSSYDGFLANGQNFYVYLDPRSNKFGFIPWDQDHSWGDFGHVATIEKREHASIWEPAVYDFRFLKRVLQTESFRAVYRQKLEHALESGFNQAALFPEIDRLSALLRPAVAAESEFRLERFDKAVSSDWVPGPRNGAPEGPRAPIHQLKRFIGNRIESVRDQLDGKSQGERLQRFGG